MSDVRTEKLERVLHAARNLLLLWQNQKIAGLPRAERNAAIEGCREQLLMAVAEIDPFVIVEHTDNPHAETKIVRVGT